MTMKLVEGLKSPIGGLLGVRAALLAIAILAALLLLEKSTEEATGGAPR